MFTKPYRVESRFNLLETYAEGSELFDVQLTCFS